MQPILLLDCGHNVKKDGEEMTDSEIHEKNLNQSVVLLSF